MQPQRQVEVHNHLNGSRIVFSDGGPQGGHPQQQQQQQQQLLTAPELTQEVVVISPGLPTPPLSPFRMVQPPSTQDQVAEVNGSGYPLPSFGSYYGPSETGVMPNGMQPGGSSTLPRRSGTREERLIKFSGIGPVDETGMPIASRSSVNKPKDWYRSMFRQIHKKPEDSEMEYWSAERSQLSPTPTTENMVRVDGPAGSGKDPFTLDPYGSLPDWSELGVGDKHPQPKSIFDFEPGRSNTSGNRDQVEVVRSPENPRSPSIEATLVSELSRFEAELDSDIRGLERKLSQKQHQPRRQGWGEGERSNTSGATQAPGREQDNSWAGAKHSGTKVVAPANHYTVPVTTPHQATVPGSFHAKGTDRFSPAPEAMDFPPKREEKKMKAGRAKFNFQAQSPKELSLQKGDVVYIHRQVDANWYDGEHHGRAGIFPTSYVEIIPPSEKPTPIRAPTVQVLEYGEAVALYSFTADLPVELSFKKGEVISVTRQVDDRWLEGRVPGTARSGIFPLNYVQVNRMPRTKSSDEFPTSPASPTFPASPRSPGRPFHSPCPQSPMSPSPFTPEAQLSPAKPSSPSSPSLHGVTSTQSRSPLSQKQAANHWPHTSPGPSSPTPQTSHWSGTLPAPHSPLDRDVKSPLSTSNHMPSSPQGPGLTVGSKPAYSAQPNSHRNAPPPPQTRTNPGSTVVQRTPYKAVYNYKPHNKDELELREGDILQVMERCDDGWFVGTSERTQAFGTFPGNYVAPV